MFDPDQNAASAPTSSAFEDLMALAKLMADPKALQARLDQLTAATVKSNEVRIAAERAVVAMNNREAELAERTQALDVQEAEIRAERSRLHAWAQTLTARDVPFHAAAKKLHELDEVLRRRVLQHHHLRPFSTSSCRACRHGTNSKPRSPLGTMILSTIQTQRQ
jgi:uncharacterized protein (DUF3084 family)